MSGSSPRPVPRSEQMALSALPYTGACSGLMTRPAMISRSACASVDRRRHLNSILRRRRANGPADAAAVSARVLLSALQVLPAAGKAD